MSAPFVDPDDLKVTLQINDTFSDDDLEAACNAATEALQEELGRKFSKDASDVTRLYTAIDPFLLNIRDLVSLTSLKTDPDGDGTFEITWGTDDYKILPLNASTDLEPFRTICVDGRNGENRFPIGVQGGVQIVGKWGWPKLPQKLVMACRIIATQLFKRSRENPGFIITSDMAIVILRNDPQINALLKGLARPKVVEN